MRATDDQLTFRAWLVKQLTLTRWSVHAGPKALPVETPLSVLAERLGVTLSVLEEAQALRDAELKKRGQGGIMRGRRRYIGNDYTELEVRMPPSIFATWREFCTARQIEPGTVFRSLIHHFLLSACPPARPPAAGPQWMIRGKIFPMTKEARGLKAKTRLTRGADVALGVYADQWDLKPTSVARGILTDFLEGKILRVKMVAFGELWGDPDRYLHPEKFR